MLAEAACELFLESGYDETSVTEIARRAGVARSSFFNYASTKAELLWGGLDERIDRVRDAVDSGMNVEEAIGQLADGLAPDALALAFANGAAMRIEQHLEVESAVRMSRIASIAARSLEAAGLPPMEAAVFGGAYGAAVIAALRSWALSGAGTEPLDAHVRRALKAVSEVGRS